MGHKQSIKRFSLSIAFAGLVVYGCSSDDNNNTPVTPAADAGTDTGFTEDAAKPVVFETNTQKGALPQFAMTTAAEINAYCDTAVATARASIDALKVTPSADLLGPDRINTQIDTAWSGLDIVLNAHPDAAMRDAAEACETRLGPLWRELFGTPEIAASIKAFVPADATDTFVKQAVLDSFEENGATLDAAGRAKFKELADAIELLQKAYDKKISDDQALTVELSEAEVAGVAADVLADLERSATNGYKFPNNYPSFDAVVTYGTNPEGRRKIFQAYYQIGGSENMQTMNQIVSLRQQMAALFGSPSYAAWVLKSRMAKELPRVESFLTDIETRSNPLRAKRYADLLIEKKTATGDQNAVLNGWDTAFYGNIVDSRKSGIDPDTFRAYFPAKGTVNWMLAVASKLYGITFKPNTALKTWHPDVLVFDIFEDDGSGAYVSTVYLDLYPRPNKYGHAAAWNVRAASTKQAQTPVSVVLANLGANGLTVYDTTTLFHEFGHVLHGTLSKTRYTFKAGTNTKTDFVEAPSQMFEAWPLRPEVIALRAEACADCKPIDETTRVAMVGEGTPGRTYASQSIYARYDLTLYKSNPPQDATALWNAQTGSDLYFKNTLFPANFAHISGGYAAGYYSYMWSEVFAKDMATMFGSNYMDAAVGKRYRTELLEKGGEADPMDILVKLLGRQPNTQAFLDGIK